MTDFDVVTIGVTQEKLDKLLKHIAKLEAALHDIRNIALTECPDGLAGHHAISIGKCGYLAEIALELRDKDTGKFK